MKLKLSCADFTFPLLPHDQVLKLVSMLGVQGVDIGVLGGRSHIRPEHIIRNIPGFARDLSMKVQDLGLEISDIFLIPGSFEYLSVNHPHVKERKKSRELFLRMLEFTARCNARHMTALPGTPWKSEPLVASLKRSSEELSWRLERAQDSGITFSVEPHIGSVSSNPKDALKLVNMTPGLTLTLDYGHFTSVGIPDSEVEPLVSAASHFHVRGAYKGRLQAPFKDNIIDYRRVLRAMKKSKYSGYLALEYVWIDWEHCNETDNLSETILFRDFFNSVKI